jgi:ribonucleoside-diphosphate reductase beta chain
MGVDYTQQEKSYRLFDDAKRLFWDPRNITFGQDREDWETFTEPEKRHFLTLMAAFYEAEGHVTRTLTPYIVAVEAIEDPAFDPVQEQMYLTTQLFEEAKHMDFYSRFFGELFDNPADTDTFIDTDADKEVRNKGEGGYHAEDHLYDMSGELLDVVRAGDQTRIVRKLGAAVMLYMGIIENQHARVASVQTERMLEKKADELGRDTVMPGFQEGFGKVRTDEGRHIQNGQWLLGRLAEMDSGIVTEVYEPMLERYLDNRLPPKFDENPFDLDIDHSIQCAKQSLEATVRIIGPEKFDRIGNVQDAFEDHSVPVPADD